MKKIAFYMAAGAALVLASCGRGGNKLDKLSLQTNEDSISYALGAQASVGLDQFAFDKESGLGIDSADVETFIQGIIDGCNLKESKQDSAYYSGVLIGQQLCARVNQQLARAYGLDPKTIKLNKSDMLNALIAGFKGDTTLITPEEADMMVTRIAPIIKAAQYAGYKAENEKYMEEVAQQEDVKTLEGGVCYKVITEGEGETPLVTDRVKVHYEGKTIDGNIFDSSYERGEPTTFPCNQVISGWTVALTNMPVGSKWEVYIPAEMGYGERGAGSIKPYSTLVFTVELVEIVRPEESK